MNKINEPQMFVIGNSSGLVAWVVDFFRMQYWWYLAKIQVIHSFFMQQSCNTLCNIFE